MVAHAYQNFTPHKWMINASSTNHEQYLYVESAWNEETKSWEGSPGVTMLVNYLYRESGTPVGVPQYTNNGTQHYNVYQGTDDRWYITAGITPTGSYGNETSDRHVHTADM
jgi:hypothetical protein